MIIHASARERDPQHGRDRRARRHAGRREAGRSSLAEQVIARCRRARVRHLPGRLQVGLRDHRREDRGAEITGPKWKRPQGGEPDGCPPQEPGHHQRNGSKARSGSRRGPAGGPEARPGVSARSNNLDRIALIFWIIRVSGFQGEFERSVKNLENRGLMLRTLPMI
jgi:hypothetical protein